MVVKSPETKSVDAIDGLTYREIQAKLKELGQPAKGPDKVLRERLADVLQGVETGEAALASEDEQARSAENNSGPTSPANGAGPSQPRTARKKAKPSKEKVESPKSPRQKQRFVVTTEVEEGETGDEGSRAHKLQSAAKAAFPDSKTTLKRFSTGGDFQGAETPLQKVKRVARDSASKLQQSTRSSAQKLQQAAGDLQERIGRRGLGWLWPLLAALLLGLLLAGAYGARKDSQALRYISQRVDELYDASQTQAARLGDNLYRGYSYTLDGISTGTGRLMGTGGSYVSDAYGRVAPYLPSTRRFRASLPTSACCARLNATVLESLTLSAGPWAGVAVSLKDAWAGLKDDPNKATGVLLAGGSTAALQKATATIRNAVPADCKHCYLLIKGEDLMEGGQEQTGRLQRRLVEHLEGCPYAIVVVEGVHHVHADALPTFLYALSEQGSLTLNGKSTPTNKALYIGTTVVPEPLLEKTDEEEFAAAVKRDLVFKLSTPPVETPAVPEAFRRRWDIVAPLN